MSSDSGREGGDLFIVENSDADWKASDYLREWTDTATAFDSRRPLLEGVTMIALCATKSSGAS